MEQEKLLGVRVGVVGASRSLVDVYREYIDGGPYAGSTRYQYEASLRLHVEPYFRQRTIGSLQPKELRGWLAWMVEERGYARSTVVNRYGILRGVLGYAVANGYRAQDPSRGWSTSRHYSRRGRRKTVRLPTLAEITAIAERLPAPYRLLVWLMAGCGLRIGEASAVCLQQFDFAAGMLIVDRQITQDGGAPQAGRRRRRGADVQWRGRAHRIRHLKWRAPGEGWLVPLPSVIAAKVREHVRRHGTFRVADGPNRMAGDYLFANIGRTNILMYALVHRLWQAARRAAGVTRKVTPQWLRHFFASVGLAKGVPVTDMAAWLGHSDPRTTYEIYAHVLPDAPERLRSVMDDVLSLKTQLVLPLQFEFMRDTATPR
ncbi:tyrosine-type recombinase/integrase [Streptomyces sp. NPDC008137]|uniref:tyrosine-type recombinase/integrase n=1 Tax=Streptomyces sp. NPDC008137 TaxID=3364813 RepID=UPI0036EC7A6A